ncbi:hypothetical protein LCGC14_2765660, partial [marine sediment metagenome]
MKGDEGMRRIVVASACLIALSLGAAQARAGKDDVQPVTWHDYFYVNIRSLDPATCGDTASSKFQANVFEGLYSYHYLKRPPTLVPLLAAEMPRVSEDGLTYTIKLKGGVKFARNGCFGRDASGKLNTRTVTAADFVYAFKRIKDSHLRRGMVDAFLADRIVGAAEYRKKTGRYAEGDFRRYDLDIPGLKAVDELTLRIRLNRPWSQMTHILAMHSVAPIPHEAVDYWLAGAGTAGGGRTVPVSKREAAFTRPEQLVGTGPYLWDKYEPRAQVRFVGNPDFRKRL